MASIKTLFDRITIIRPEKVGLLGIEGLEQELIANVRLLVEEIWDSLPLKKEYSMPIIDDNALPILENYSSEDLLQTHLSSINESIKIVSTLLQEIQKRTKAPETNLKKRTKMPSSFNDCQINTSTGVFLTSYSGLTGNSNLEDGCDAMGIPCSIDNLLNYGEMLFSTYKNAAVMIEDFVTRTASMVMTEDEIKEFTSHREFENVHFPCLYDDVEKLEHLCYKLINHGYLEKSTSTNDFVYFFSGNGKIPNEHLKWIKSNIELAMFLDCCFIKLNIKPRWKISEKIFNVKNLKQSRNNTESKKASEVMKINNLFNTLLNI